MASAAAELALLTFGVLLAVCHALENTTSALRAAFGGILFGNFQLTLLREAFGAGVGSTTISLEAFCQQRRLRLGPPVWKEHPLRSLSSSLPGGMTVSSLAAKSPPVAAAVRSHFNSCPDAHSTFCFHGTCRFLVQEEEPTCVCHSGYMGARCELADLLAVVAATQKKQTITALVVVSVIASIVVIMVCILIHCCRIRKHCEWCRTMVCGHEKPTGLLKGATSCCHSETVV